MKRIGFLAAMLLFYTTQLHSQLCPGGGLTFASAVGFNQGWLTNCPGSGTTHNNQVACEPTTTMDACAPAAACVTGTTGSDIWYYFYAGATTATIVINPSASFDAALQAFSGSVCGVLTDIGCADAGGNNQSETLNLTSLTMGQLYYFRVFGATASAPNRTGTYTFCGTSSNLRQFGLPVVLTSFTASAEKTKVVLKWTASEIGHDHYVIERSTDNNQFTAIGSLPARGVVNELINYISTDLSPVQGINYYRLKMVDVNGQAVYSSITTARIYQVKPIQIVSNPVNDVLVIQSRSAIRVAIINSSGQQVKTVTLNPGRNNIVVTDLSAGTYFLSGVNTDEPEKFIVNR